MKRTSLLLLSLTLCLALLMSACGKSSTETKTDTGTATTDTTTPSTTTTTPAASSGPVYPLQVKAGDTVKADLDGDGTEEEIVYSVKAGTDASQAVLTINGTEFGADLSSQGFTSTAPEADYCCLTDIDSSDKLLEIAVMDAGPSDDHTTAFFHYASGALTYLGSAEGYAMNADGSAADMDFHGFGTVNAIMRLSVLQTWYAKADYRLNGDKLEQALQSLYSPNGEDGTSVTTKLEVAGYSDRDATSDKSAIPAGTALTLGSTDNAEWIMATDGDDNEYWLHLDKSDTSKVELNDGTFAAGADALDGLVLAD